LKKIIKNISILAIALILVFTALPKEVFAETMYYYDKYRVVTETRYREGDWRFSEWISYRQMKEDEGSMYRTKSGFTSYTFNDIRNSWSMAGRSDEVGYYNHGTIYYINGSGNKTKLWRVEFDNSGRWTYRKEISDNTTYLFQSRGSLVGRIIAADGKYPENGVHTDGYWYIKGGLANASPNLVINHPILNERIGNQDNLIINGSVKDSNVGDILKVKYSLEDVKNREITLTQPNTIVANGQTQSFQGYINLGGLSSGNKVLELYSEDNKGGISNKVNVPINVFSSLESILKSLRAYTYKSGQVQFLVVNTDTIIIQSTNNDNLIDQIKKELKDKNVKLYFIGKDSPTKAYLESKLLK
jgi:hypothetical protein